MAIWIIIIIMWLLVTVFHVVTFREEYMDAIMFKDMVGSILTYFIHMLGILCVISLVIGFY